MPFAPRLTTSRLHLTLFDPSSSTSSTSPTQHDHIITIYLSRATLVPPQPTPLPIATPAALDAYLAALALDDCPDAPPHAVVYLISLAPSTTTDTTATDTIDTATASTDATESVPLGYITLSQRTLTAEPDIGWAILPAQQGRGYATEAADAVLRHAQLDMDVGTVLVFTAQGNGASNRVAEKLGFRRKDRRRWRDGDGERRNVWVLWPVGSGCGGRVEGGDSDWGECLTEELRGLGMVDCLEEREKEGGGCG